MNPLLVLGLVVGFLAPIVVAVVTIYLGTFKQPNSGGLVRAMGLGLLYGALGGLAVSGLTIALVLLLR